NILHLIYESSDDGIEDKYGGIENNIEGKLGIEYEKNTEDKPGTEYEKETENEPDIELEEDINIKNIWSLGRMSRDSSKYVLHKTALSEKQRNKSSKRIGCLFLVNACNSKGSDNETIIKLISINLEHNYLLVPENTSFATSYQKLTTEIKELIENYVFCDIDVLTQVRLFYRLFPETTIHFEKECTKNPDWYIQSLIDPETNKLQDQTIEAIEVQFSTFMIDANPGLESQLAKLLGDHYADFIKKQLIIDFSESTKYLLRQLDPRKTTWTKAFTGRVFTARIISTQQSKSIKIVDNRLIKFEYDFHQIHFDELFEEIDHSLVVEIWEVQSIEHKSNVEQNSEKAYFYISLISRCWYKDKFMDAVVVDKLFLRRKSLEKNTPVQAIAKAIGHKQLIKETLLGLAYKCIEIVNYNDLNNLTILIETFKEWIHIHKEAQYSKQIIEQKLDNNQIVESDQGIKSNQDTKKNDQDIKTTQLDIQNPLKYIKKVCLSKKYIKSAIEKPKKHKYTSSRTSCQCKLMMTYE
ncbi:28213_t:CDS:10, partial [Dentiscutata erythropus]